MKNWEDRREELREMDKLAKDRISSVDGPRTATPVGSRGQEEKKEEEVGGRL